MNKSIAALLTLLLLIAVVDVSIAAPFNTSECGEDNSVGRHSNPGNAQYITGSTAIGSRVTHPDTHRWVCAFSPSSLAAIQMACLGRVFHPSVARGNPMLVLLVAGRSPPSTPFATFE